MTPRDHLFASSTDGALYDTRVEGWAWKPALRPIYSRHFHEITNAAELKACLRAGAYTSLGGYPLYFLMSDGGAMSFDAVRDNLRQILPAMADPSDRSGTLPQGEASDGMRKARPSGWRVVACEINYEDQELYCCQTSERIPAAYGDDESPD